jgi:ABC-type amino acid transport system permease subunit
MSVSNSTFRFTETFFAAGLYYLVVITAVTWLLNRLEKAFAVPGFGRDS